MSDDAATVREELHWHTTYDSEPEHQDSEALAALDRLAAQAARADRYEEALRAIEWVWDGATEDRCPSCGMTPKRGHDSSCSTGKALNAETSDA